MTERALLLFVLNLHLARIAIGAADATPVKFSTAHGALLIQHLQAIGGEKAAAQIREIDLLIRWKESLIQESRLGQRQNTIAARRLPNGRQRMRLPAVLPATLSHPAGLVLAQRAH